MRRSTLAHGRSGWAHPYGHGPFSPFLYADGGDGGDSGSTDGDSGGDEGAAESGTGEEAAKDDDGEQVKEKPKPAPPKGGPDQSAEVARLTKELADARKEAGKERTAAKEGAAQEARNALVKDLGKVLGLIKDEKDTPPDPAKLTAEIERATAAHRDTAVELAVWKGAAQAGADPGALTDSRAFMTSLGKLDPSAEDFGKKVAAAIEKAVTDNPKLAATPAKSDSGSTDFSGSTGDKADGPQTIDDIRAERRKRRAG